MRFYGSKTKEGKEVKIKILNIESIFKFQIVILISYLFKCQAPFSFSSL